MKGLYDIHCHILPGVDDGARNMEESLWMLNKEYQEGVRHVILTPHFRYDMFEPHMNIVTRQFMQLRRAAMNIGDEGMRLYLGCELHSSMDMVECLKKGRRLTLAGSRYVLVEFSNGDEKNYIEELKEEHPEFQPIEIEMIEENQHPDIADQYDYYYVPTFYVDGVKVHEAGIFKNEMEALLRKVIE